MKGINLLEKSTLETEDTRNLKRRLVVYTVVILVAFTILNLVVFFLLNSQARKINDVNLEVNAQENLINSLKDKEIKHHVLKEKISYLTLIAKEKSDIASIIRFLQELESLGVLIGDLSIIADKISLSATAPDSNILTSALSFLIDNEQGKKLFKEVTMNGLIFDKKGQYNFSINLTPNSYEGI